MKVNLGGDRLGSGNKMEQNIHGFGKSTHDLGYIWRNTQSFGTCVPFLNMMGLTGDKFEIDIDFDVQTKPTVGPLYGSAKLQGDVAIIPLRLYLGALMINEKNVANKMDTIKFPQIRMKADNVGGEDIDNCQINPSSIFAYQGIRGLGKNITGATEVERQFTALKYLAYHDFCAQYYANKQEKIGAVIHKSTQVDTINWVMVMDEEGIPVGDVPKVPGEPEEVGELIDNNWISLNYSTLPELAAIKIYLEDGVSHVRTEYTLDEVFDTISYVGAHGIWFKDYKPDFEGSLVINYDYATNPEEDLVPRVVTFDLENIDQVKKDIIKAYANDTIYEINDTSIAPYGLPLKKVDGKYAKLSNQEGLWVKTKQSDMFTSWLNTEDIDAINYNSRVSTTGGAFTIDVLNMAMKVWEQMNRNQLTDGTWNSWQEVNYGASAAMMISTPAYVGGISREIIFQEVVSNSATPEQPLATLGGRGKLSSKKKGGRIVIKLDEPCIILGVCAATPRVDYTQGNMWDMNLKTMADLHVPILDGIAFQDAITDGMAWWDTNISDTGVITYKSAGKQTAWLNYQTNVNRSYGNFAIKGNEMFMIFAAQYQPNDAGNIRNLTSYINPADFNYMWAETRLDAMNMWIQASVDIKATRVMSANQIPNIR